VASVSAGEAHVLALTYTGGVYSWGQHEVALGHGLSSGRDMTIGRLPTGLPRRIQARRGLRVRCVAAGGSHSQAVTEEGHVHTWGEGRTGALGHEEFTDEWLPRAVEMLCDKDVWAVGVAAGGEHTLVADAGGAVWGFGSLNAIGAWRDFTVMTMRGNYRGSEEDAELFRGPEEEFSNPSDNLVDCFNFLYPRGRASICQPVRTPVHVRVHGPGRPVL
jgi:alpha-tubulin suppressor-like RCC1 family protein